MPLSTAARTAILAGCKFAQLHTGDPGPDCTASQAKQALRVPATLDDSGTNAGALQWPLCPAAETITHVSLWDDAKAGNPWLFGPLAAPVAVAVNQLFEIKAGTLKATLS